MSNETREHDLLDELADEFVSRKQAGEHPTMSEYCERHPKLAEEIRQLFPMLVMLEDVKPRPDEQAARHEPVPQQVSGYRILREIGRGGMGVVYEAKQELLGRHVALKILPQRLAHNAQALARFQREARAVASLHHTNIVPLFEMGEDQGHAFLAMQLIRGRNLHEIIAGLRETDSQDALDRLSQLRPQSTQASAAESLSDSTQATKHSLADTAALSGSSVRHDEPYRAVARIGLQLAEALEYAHARGIIHRDIKPSNVLLDDIGTVWLTDFGLAKTDDEDLTRTGDFLGTLRYMAPERFRGRCDARSDIYAAGLTLYELLSRRPCFDAADRLELIDQINQSTPPRPRAMNPSIPRDLETIVLKASEKDADSRYPTAHELAEDLRHFLEDQPIRARRISTAERLVRWTRRNRALAASLSLATLLTLALAVGSLVAAIHFEAERDWANQQKNRAVAAEELALRRAELLEAETAKAVKAEAIAQAVNSFLTKDLLAQAAPTNNPNREATLREVLDRAAASVAGRFPDQPEVEAEIRRTIGNAYQDLATYKEATLQFTLARKLAQSCLGDEDRLTLALSTDLAGTYQRQGRLDEAETLLLQVLETQRRVLGSDDTDTLSTENMLAGNYQEQGRLDLAEELFRNVLETRRRTQGDEHEKTLAVEANLGGLYQRMGRKEEAERLLRASVERTNRVLGEKHPLTLTVQNNLALVFLQQERIAGAQTLLEKLVDPAREVLGEDHAGTLSIHNNLAAIYYTQKEYERAEPLFQRVIESRERVLGEKHPETLGGKNNLGLLFQRQGKLAEAEAMFVAALAGQQEILGGEHPKTLNTQTNLGMLYAAQKRWEDSERLFRRTLAADNTVLPPDHALKELARGGLTYIYETRSQAAAREQDWRVAAQDQLDLVQTQPERVSNWSRGAGWILLAEDRDAFESYRLKMLNRFATTDDPATAGQVTHAFVLASVPESRRRELGQVAALAETALRVEDPPRLAQAQLIRGIVAYRQSHWDKAREWLDQARATGRWRPESAEAVEINLVQAMIAHQQGANDLARRRLSELRPRIDGLPPASSAAGNPNWQACQVLVREAEALIGG